MAKAEWLPGLRGYNARFVVTYLSEEHYDASHMYEDQYCARGDMENRIKEQQLSLFADRTSTSRMHSNQLRLYFRLCSEDDHQGDWAPGRRDGLGAVRNHPCEAAEDRRGPARKHTPVPLIVFLGLSTAVARVRPNVRTHFVCA